jgi:hypothetical protein
MMKTIFESILQKSSANPLVPKLMSLDKMSISVKAFEKVVKVQQLKDRVKGEGAP